MIVRFVTGKHFNPNAYGQTDVFRNRNQMRKNKSIFTTLERLPQAAKNSAMHIEEMGEKEVDIIVDGYLPEHARGTVTKPFTRRGIAVHFQEV